jgi:hypothetical protein
VRWGGKEGRKRRGGKGGVHEGEGEGKGCPKYPSCTHDTYLPMHALHATHATHAGGRSVPVEEVKKALAEVRESGRVRMEEALAACSKSWACRLSEESAK